LTEKTVFVNQLTAVKTRHN